MHFNYSSSSGLKTATAQIWTGPGGYSGLDVTPPTSGYTIVTVYDGTDDTGVVLTEAFVDAGFISLNHEYFSPIALTKGIYCTLTGTGAGSKYIVRFIPG